MEAVSVLEDSDLIYVRSSRLPVLEALRAKWPKLEIRSFDDLYESHETADNIYAASAARVLALVRDQDVVYCVPGSPMTDEPTVDGIRSLAGLEGREIRIIHGVSNVDAVLAAVGQSDRTWLAIVDGEELDRIVRANAFGSANGHPGILPVRTPMPTAPLLITPVSDPRAGLSIKTWLSRYWPENHLVSVVTRVGHASLKSDVVALPELDQFALGPLTSVFVPAVDPGKDTHTFSGLVSVTRTLRAPGGCPWDREQTHDSLKSHLLEETYEVIEALDEHDYDKLRGELGDLLFQVMIHSQVAAEVGNFDVTDVITAINEKLIRRHPHVFGDIELSTSSAVLERWETMKQLEMPDRQSVLEGIPLATPALPYSIAVQKRAASQGFEWVTLEDVLDKVAEELLELRLAVSEDEGAARVSEELGDLFFALVSAARWMKVDPEESLRNANRKFVARYQYVERRCNAEGRVPRDLSPQDLDSLWERAKASVAGPPPRNSR
jgi:tetrapyrrole methylase family protein/MazG family protein